MSLVDALQGIADEAHAARGKIVEPAEIVEQGARQRIGVERVDREIAPRGVFAPVVGIIDDRVAAVGRNVAAQRRHLDQIGRAPSELQSLMRNSYAVFCLKKKKQIYKQNDDNVQPISNT